MLDSDALLYAVVEFQGERSRQVPQVTVMFASVAEASGYADGAGLDAFTVAPVHFHLATTAAGRDGIASWTRR